MKPEWMPPLPDVEQEIYGLSRRFVGAPVQSAVRQMMTDYALAAVEAYRKKLEPALKVDLSNGRLAFVAVESVNYRDGDLLYRLDGRNAAREP